MGDVHLMAAVGAVLGWFEPILVPFAAAFCGLGWVVLSRGLSALFRGMRRELPFGPHLAVGTVVLVLCRPALDWAWRGYFPPNLPMPRPGLITADPGPLQTPPPLAPPIRPPAAADSTPSPGSPSPPAGRIQPDPLS